MLIQGNPGRQPLINEILKDKVNKIAPIRNSEIRVLKLEKETTKLSIMPSVIPRSYTIATVTEKKEDAEASN